MRQIEVRAFEKLQKAVRHRVAAMQMLETPLVSNTAPAPWVASTGISNGPDAQRRYAPCLYPLVTSRASAFSIWSTDGKCHVASA